MDSHRLRRFEVARTVLVVVITNCATLVLELCASRLLAPWVGSTLHTWTTIIGVVLLGVAAGSYVGGRVADRSASVGVLAAIVGLSAASLLLAWLVPTWLGPWQGLRAIPLLARTVLLTTFGFLPASALLSAATPVALRQLLPNMASAGRVAGVLSALGTVGSLAGNYLTGLVLFAFFNVSSIVVATAAALALLTVVLLAVRRLEGTRANEPVVVAVTREAAAVAVAVPGLLARPMFAHVLVAITAFAMLSLELGASRLLAPVLRVSIISWTGIIGVVLIGIAVGNTVGGFIADRSPRVAVVSTSLLLSAVACTLVVPIHAAIVAGHAFQTWSYIPRVLAHTGCLFLLPVTLLATVSPQVVKLAITSIESAGRTSGSLWAAGTVGALLGAFVTGWELIGTWGASLVMAALGALLLVSAMVVGNVWRSPRRLGASLATFGFLATLAWAGAFRSSCTVESDYFCITVVDREDDGRSLRAMRLDMLTHSLIDLKDAEYVGYDHIHIHTEYLTALSARVVRPRVLLIGGGGYSLPRWIDQHLPSIEVDVVEIDPAVTRVAFERFDVRQTPSLRSFPMDGRQFVQERRDTGDYDAVFLDAVNDFAIPWHLVTREFFSAAQSRLRPGGVFFLTLIDEVPKGAFFPAVLRTMRAAFKTTAVAFPASSPPNAGLRTVVMLMGSNAPIDLEKIRTDLIAAGHEPFTTVMKPELIEQALQVSPGLSMSDDYAPVDNMMASVFLEAEDLSSARDEKPLPAKADEPR